MKSFASGQFQSVIASGLENRPAGSIGSENLTLLIVEDDPNLLCTLTYSLTRAGFRVISASDGEAGLACAREVGDQLDLIILDVMLPRMSGLQVLRAIRSNSNTPVMMLSARGEVQD